MTVIVISVAVVTVMSSGAWFYLVLFTTAKDPAPEDTSEEVAVSDSERDNKTREQ